MIPGIITVFGCLDLDALDSVPLTFELEPATLSQGKTLAPPEYNFLQAALEERAGLLAFRFCRGLRRVNFFVAERVTLRFPAALVCGETGTVLLSASAAEGVPRWGKRPPRLPKGHHCRG